MKKLIFSISGIVFISLFSNRQSNAQWVQTNQINAPGPISELDMIGSEIFAGATCSQGHGSMFISNDAGGSWTAINNGLPEYTSVYLVSMIGSRVFVGTGGGAQGGNGIYVTDDNGATWVEANNGIPLPAWANTIYQDGSTIFAGVSGTVYRSTDNGDTWIESASGLTTTTVQVIIKKGTTLFAGTNNGVFKSDNDGNSWSASSNGLPLETFPSPSYTIAFKMAVVGSNILLGSYSDGLFISTDNGSNWTNVNYEHVDDFVVHGNVVYASFYGQVYISTDFGLTWSSINEGLETTIVSSLTKSSTHLYAGTSGNCQIWKRPLSEITSITELNEKPTFSIAPNPFDFQTTITFDNEQKNVMIKISDILGKEMKTVRFTGKQFIIEKGELNAGVYLVKIQDHNNNIAAMKIAVR